MSCPVCASGGTVQLLDVGELPILCNQLCSTKESARRVALGRVQLSFCPDCGHFFNHAFDETRVRYSPEYENSLHCSGTFQSYADISVRRLVERYDLRKKRVMEVGCGQGDFLRSVCAAGDNVGFGFDPSYAGGNRDPRVTIHSVSFADVEDGLDADLVCCRHVLEHIGEPRKFLEALSLKLKPGTAVYFEVPNALFTIRDGGVWDIIYEHCGYFSPSSLRHVFELAGFNVDEVAEAFDGQFVVVHASVAEQRPSTPAPVDPELADLVTSFKEAYEEKIADWCEVLREASSNRERVVAWGAGSKGNTFLNVVGGELAAIVDINPKKHGKFVAGTAQPIVAPEELSVIRPDVVVVMNPVYRPEVVARLDRLGIRPRVLVA